MKEKTTGSTNFPMAGLIWMFGFHLSCFILEVITYLFLIPGFQKTFQEFGIDLPTTTKLVFSFRSFWLVLLLAMLGTFHVIVVGLYALLAGSNQLQWARMLAWVTFIIWLIWLFFHVAALGIPYLAIIEGLTSTRK